MASLLSAERVSCAALRDVRFSIEEKTLNLLFGSRGCGKGALLRTLGLLEPPAQGDVLYRGKPTRALPPEERAALRNRHFGFLFAEAYLLPSFSVVENVAMPFFRISCVDTGDAQNRTRTLLDFVGLGDREQVAVHELSRAEQQRVALARALVNRPEIVMVETMAGAPEDDRPAFCETLRRAAEEFAAAFIVTASDDALAGAMDHSFEVARGAVRPLSRAGGGA